MDLIGLFVASRKWHYSLLEAVFDVSGLPHAPMLQELEKQTEEEASAQ